MIEMETCEELDEMVQIDIVPMEGTTMTVPFNVGHRSRMKGSYPNVSPLPSGACRFATALMSLAQADNGDVTATIKPSAKLTATPSREQAGIIYTHSLEMPINTGFQAIRDNLEGMEDVDFLIVLTDYFGRQWLSYAVPGSSQIGWKDGKAPFTNGTLTAQLKSRSPLILLSTE